MTFGPETANDCHAPDLGGPDAVSREQAGIPDLVDDENARPDVAPRLRLVDETNQPVLAAIAVEIRRGERRQAKDPLRVTYRHGEGRRHGRGGAELGQCDRAVLGTQPRVERIGEAAQVETLAQGRGRWLIV